MHTRTHTHTRARAHTHTHTHTHTHKHTGIHTKVILENQVHASRIRFKNFVGIVIRENHKITVEPNLLGLEGTKTL